MYPGGRLSDALSRKTMLMSALLVTILGTLTIASASSYLVFVGGVTTFGVGAGLYWISLRTLLTDIFHGTTGAGVRNSRCDRILGTRSSRRSHYRYPHYDDMRSGLPSFLWF